MVARTSLSALFIGVVRFDVGTQQFHNLLVEFEIHLFCGLQGCLIQVVFYVN
jgi:hypothetical protein